VPYPIQDIPLSQLKAYIDTYIVPNGQGLILGVEHNNVENALLKYILQSPLNWSKSQVVSFGGVFAINKPVTIFYSSVPTSVSWSDNIYNEFVIVNATNSVIPLASGTYYYDINFQQKTSIPAKTSLTLCKAESDLWFQVNGSTLGATGLQMIPQRIQFVVGDPNSYIGSINQSLVHFPAEGDTEFTIDVAGVKDSFSLAMLGVGELPRDVTDVGKSYGILYQSSSMKVNIYDKFYNKELYIIRFNTTAVASAYANVWTVYTATDEQSTTDPIPELEGATILFVAKSITPLKPSEYSFDPDTLEIQLLTPSPLQPDESLFINYATPIG